MSTSISNGYRLPTWLTLETLMGWVREVRPVLEQAAALDVLGESIKRAVGTLDKRALLDQGLPVSLKGEPVRGDALGAAWMGLLNDAMVADSQRRRHYADAEASLTVFAHPTGLYALLFASMGSVHQAFRALEGVEGFAYWNNTDPPEGVDDEAWEQRGEFWDELLGPSGVPAVNGLSATLIGQDALVLRGLSDLLTPENLGLVPSLAKRAYDAAQALPEAELPDEVKEELKKNPSSFAGVMRHMRHLKDGKIPAFNEARKRVEALLDPDLTWDKLKQPWSPSQE